MSSLLKSSVQDFCLHLYLLARGNICLVFAGALLQVCIIDRWSCMKPSQGLSHGVRDIKPPLKTLFHCAASGPKIPQ